MKLQEENLGESTCKPQKKHLFTPACLAVPSDSGFQMKAEAPNVSVRSGAGSLADISWDSELGRVQYNTKCSLLIRRIGETHCPKAFLYTRGLYSPDYMVR